MALTGSFEPKSLRIINLYDFLKHKLLYINTFNIYFFGIEIA